MSKTTKVFQINFEAMAVDLAKENNEFKNVLEWASENVELCQRAFSGESGMAWAVAWKGNRVTTAHTLYQALYTAWENREK